MRKLRIFAMLLTMVSVLTLVTAHEAQADGETLTVQIIGVAQPPGFAPAFLTIHVYDTVVFVNHALPSASYTVTSLDGSIASPVIRSGTQWTVTFAHAGAFEYHDPSQPKLMSGEILVVASNTALLPTPNPLAEATVIAAIQAGKTPPDVQVLPTPTASSLSKTNLPLFAPFVLPAILIVINILGLVLIGSIALLLYRKHLARLRQSAIAAQTSVQTKRWGQQIQTDPDQSARKSPKWQFWRKHEEDDDDESDEDEDI